MLSPVTVVNRSEAAFRAMFPGCACRWSRARESFPSRHLANVSHIRPRCAQVRGVGAEAPG